MRKAAVAGTFYNKDPIALKKQVQGYLDQAAPEGPEGEIIGLVSPHAGYAFSGQAAAHGYRLLDPERVRRAIVLAPSHSFGFRGASVFAEEGYETPLGAIPIDQLAAATLVSRPFFNTIPEVHVREHSLEVQLPFLQARLPQGFYLLPVVIGQLEMGDHEQIAAGLREIIEPGDVVIASSDFTHQGHRFGFVPYAENVRENIQRLDMGAVETVLTKNSAAFLGYVRQTGATICGAHPIGILMALLPDNAVGRLLTYYTSADVTGDDMDTVSYAAIAFAAPSGWRG